MDPSIPLKLEQMKVQRVYNYVNMKHRQPKDTDFSWLSEEERLRIHLSASIQTFHS